MAIQALTRLAVPTTRMTARLKLVRWLDMASARSLPASVMLVLILGGCASLPSLESRIPSTPMGDTSDTLLGKASAKLTRSHPDLSGIVPLFDSGDAFAARVLLADAAQRSIDVQYYIWHDDLSGTMLFEALRRAADRGVRVRILLDDNNTAGLDAKLAAVARYPHIELRLFNPFALRGARFLNYLTEFRRLNRRMHNKGFTVDNQVTIVGGRNIGDEYFDVTDAMTFLDLDVMAIGPVVDQVAADFERYWSSDSSYPAQLLLAAPAEKTTPGRADASMTASGKATASGSKISDAVDARDTRDHVNGSAHAASAYLEALRHLPVIQGLLQGTQEFEWSLAQVVADDPAKGLGRAPESDFLADRLRLVVGTPKSSLHIVSPYFVPSNEVAQRLAALAGAGVKVRLLTNSLQSSDVAVVHAAYAKWRVPLLSNGVEIFELMPGAALPRREARASLRGSLPSSAGNSLHAKVMAMDDQRFFVGSFNLDRRSRDTNTEMGLLIDSPVLATMLSSAFVQRIPALAYRLSLSENGSLRWHQTGPAGETVHLNEPGGTFLNGVAVDVLSVLPLDFLF